MLKLNKSSMLYFHTIDVKALMLVKQVDQVSVSFATIIIF